LEGENTLPTITVGDITENEDGSANVVLDLDPESVRLLINVGFNQLLREHLEKETNDNN
tara:strand:- start:166 stop:342 length:177 start_codon:yes stop_codon:yes gene_type:complete